MDGNRIFSVAVAELITRELEQGANSRQTSPAC
jgi:hypothetical protein